MTASARLEVRVRPDSKTRLERAAGIERVPLSDFVRSAAEARADEVLREHDATTRVPTPCWARRRLACQGLTGWCPRSGVLLPDSAGRSQGARGEELTPAVVGCRFCR